MNDEENKKEKTCDWCDSKGRASLLFSKNNKSAKQIERLLNQRYPNCGRKL